MVSGTWLYVRSSSRMCYKKSHHQSICILQGEIIFLEAFQVFQKLFLVLFRRIAQIFQSFFQMYSIRSFTELALQISPKGIQQSRSFIYSLWLYVSKSSVIILDTICIQWSFHAFTIFYLSLKFSSILTMYSRWKFIF